MGSSPIRITQESSPKKDGSFLYFRTYHISAHGSFPPGLDDEAYAHGVGQDVTEALALCHVEREAP